MAASTTSYSFLGFNIDMAMREEKTPETRFDVRWPLIQDRIKTANADIVALLELRDLETSQTKLRHIVLEMSNLGYDGNVYYYTPFQTSFALGIFYRRSKLFVDDVRMTLLSPTKPNAPGNEKNTIAVGLLLRSLANGERFWACATHFPVAPEERKTDAIRVLNTIVRDWIEKSREPGFVFGDYNLFDDLDGDKHRAELLKDRIDLVQPLVDSNENLLAGTFKSYPGDPSPAVSVETMTRLDHCPVFSTTERTVRRLGKHAIAVGATHDVLTRNAYGSDHMAIYFEFEVV